MAILLIEGLLEKLSEEKQKQHSNAVSVATLMLTLGPLPGEVEHHTIEDRVTDLLMTVSTLLQPRIQ